MTKQMKSRRPLRDPELDRVLDKIAKLTPREIASLSENNGVSVGASTIANWRRGKVRCPLHYTMSAALRSVGLEYAVRRVRD